MHVRYTLLVGHDARSATLYDGLPVVSADGATIVHAELSTHPRLRERVKLIAVSRRFGTLNDALSHTSLGLRMPPSALQGGYRRAENVTLSRGFYVIQIVLDLPLASRHEVTVGSADVTFSTGVHHGVVKLPQSVTLLRRAS